MKAYTLRLNDQVLQELKYIGLKEHKSIRQILLELVEDRMHSPYIKLQPSHEKQKLNKVMSLLNRVPVSDIVKSIRQDRER